MSVARTLLLGAIRGYKRYVSPHKGYGCPCRVRLGMPSCSTLGLRAVSRYGAWRGLGVLRLRLRECRLVREESAPRPPRMPHAPQAGFVDCDVPCDASSCDLPGCDLPHCSLGDVCDFLGWFDCCDCGDWSGGSSDASARRRRRRRGA
jgi:putative component of membrane protein insertase Oxa1/YidC/SpoIIIJ protein YidD